MAYILKSKAQIEKAIERAKVIHPKVRVKTFGEYEVSGHAGALYTVRCARKGDVRVVSCDCVSGQYGTPCYHSVVAIAQHSYLAENQLTF
jgi:hypothetical protein